MASKLSRPCSAHDITWGKLGYQCLNCGATAVNSWKIIHEQQPTIVKK